MFPVVRNHHYVWAYYLSAWSNENDKSVWHNTSKGNISRDSVTGLSRERDFNKIQRLTHEDIAYINLWPNSESPALQTFHKHQIEYFKHASSLIDSHIEFEGSPNYAELKNVSDAIQHGIFEQTHTAIENLAKPVLDELKRGNGEFLKQPGHRTNFCNFLSQQLFRTKKIKDRCLEGIKHLAAENESHQKFHYLFERNWWYLSYKLALNMGYSLCNSAASDNHILIKNNTELDFITGDCPVINIHETANGSLEKPPEALDLYFPVSPKVAYLISTGDRYNHLSSSITVEEVQHLNIQINLNSHMNIYGTSKKSIESVRSGYR